MQDSNQLSNRNVIVSWMDLIDTGEAMLRAGLLADYGQASLESAYRAIRRRELADRDHHLENLLAALSRRESRS